MRYRAAISQMLQVSDSDLLARLASGNISALGPLYDRHHQAVVRFLARASPSPEDAEDAAHATFLTVARIAGSYDGRLGCRPWLLGIAARELSHRRRASARFARFVANLGRAIGGRRYDLRDALDARSELRQVEQALSKLSQAKRIVLLMFEVEEMSGEEIALALSIPIGTVWTRLHGARREVRARLEQAR